MQLDVSGNMVREHQGCKKAFAYGLKGQNNCTDGAHKLIYAQSECKQAAIEAKMPINEHFNLAADWFDKYPKGCFKAPCTNDTTDTTTECFFFNADGDIPKHPEGYPVCERARYVQAPDLSCGANSTCTDTEVACPTGYNVITSLDECSAAGDCDGYAEGQEFNVANPFNQRDHFPEGCFIKEDVTPGVVFWNPIKATDGITDLAKPTKPVGIPLCMAPRELIAPSA